MNRAIPVAKVLTCFSALFIAFGLMRSVAAQDYSNQIKSIGRVIEKPNFPRHIQPQTDRREFRPSTMRSDSQPASANDLNVLFAKRLPNDAAQTQLTTTSRANNTQSGQRVASPGNRITSNTPQDAPLAGLDSSSQNLLLPKPGQNKKNSTSKSSGNLNFGALGNMGMSLVIVLAAFFALAWLLKKSGGSARPNGAIPNQVVQILGRAPLNGKQMMQLVRLGDKILLLAISPSGTESLGEIVDRDEVDAVTEICMTKNPSRLRETFRETLQRVRTDRA